MRNVFGRPTKEQTKEETNPRSSRRRLGRPLERKRGKIFSHEYVIFY